MKRKNLVSTVIIIIALAAAILPLTIPYWLEAATGIGTKQIQDGAITPPKLSEAYYTETEADDLLDDKVDTDSPAYTGVVEHKAVEDALDGLVKVNGAGGYSAVTDNSSDWDTAYGWGDHAGLYSLLGHTHYLGEITDWDTPLSQDIRVDTSLFDGNLSGADDTVQKALDTLDDMVLGSGDMLKSVYDLDDDGHVDTAEDLAIPSQAAGDVLYFDGSNWVRLGKDADKYLKSGDSTVSWDTPAGTGDMTKAVYDTDADSVVDAAETLSDTSLVIESEGISSNDNDTTIPTSAAVKDYVDTNDSDTIYTAGSKITLTGTVFSLGDVTVSETEILTAGINIVLSDDTLIETGIATDIVIPYNCKITEATLLADQSGSIVIDLWKDSYANYPPTVEDTITASAKPTLSSAIKSQDISLTDWTTSLTAGDVIRVNVDSATTVTRVTLFLKLLKE